MLLKVLRSWKVKPMENNKATVTIEIDADLVDIHRALLSIRESTGFGQIVIELKHSDITDISVTTHHKPQIERKEKDVK